MSISPLAGKPPLPEMLIDPDRLAAAYYDETVDPKDPAQQVSFGTSGHRGSSLKKSFNEPHILAVAQAVCDYRRDKGIAGPLYMGKDTHALSGPAQETALAVFAANGVEVFIQAGGGFTPTPVVSHAILVHNASRPSARADGVVITPSHNPPGDGGFKYNPPHGGPAGGETTKWIQARANEYLAAGLSGVSRFSPAEVQSAGNVHEHDFVLPYVRDLANVVDLDAIRAAGLKLGVDPLGGAAVAHWEAVAEVHGLDLTLTSREVDPTFSFMRVDRDGLIRMDCSSPYAMAGLIEMKDRFDLAFGNDPDADRHGIVTAGGGLMNPNHYIAAVVNYLFPHRPDWPETAKVGKTLVTSAMVDRVAASVDRELCEVPVGFKWFVDGLVSAEFGFGGEESAGASFLRRSGRVWTTDKDGIILCLLAAEMTAVTGSDPGTHYARLTERFGAPLYERLQAPADREQKGVLARLSPEDVSGDTLAAEPITAKLTRAPGNDAPIGGLKVTTENGWFAARPSGTEDIYKIYTESFKGADHLARIQEEAQAMVAAVFKRAGV